MLFLIGKVELKRITFVNTELFAAFINSATEVNLNKKVI